MTAAGTVMLPNMCATSMSDRWHEADFARRQLWRTGSLQALTESSSLWRLRQELEAEPLCADGQQSTTNTRGMKTERMEDTPEGAGCL